MNNLLQYLAESSLALLLFYAVYRLLLSQQTCFTFNRFYLLASLLLSLFIPFLELPNWPTQPETQAKETFMQVPAGEEFNIGPAIFQTPSEFIAAEPTAPEPKPTNYWVWIFGIYAIGLSVAGIVFCRQFLKLYSFIYSHWADSYYWQQIKIIPTQGKLATFSFLRYILLDNTQPFTPVQKELILRHEQAHLTQKHSLDILFIKVLSIFFWFNPLLYFYRKALESTHEYLADAQVLQAENTESYADLLVQQVLSNTSFSLGNSFHLHQSLTLNRLAMIKKFKSASSRLRPLLALPLIGALALAFAANRPVSLPEFTPTVSNQSQTTGNYGSSGKSERNNYGYSPTDISEPAFPRGKEHLYRFLLQHLKFKPEAFGQDAIRRTVVSINIDAAGNPQTAFPQNNDLINREISRVINLMPRWVPSYQAEKGLASQYELHLLINRNAKHSQIAPNQLAKKGILNHEGIPTFSSDIIQVGINPVTGTPKNILDQVDIVEGDIVEPTFPGGKAAMERYFRENLNLEKVAGPDLAITKEFGLFTGYPIAIDQNGNIEKLVLEKNSLFDTNQNLTPHQVAMNIIGNNFHKELVALINNMPQWNPAIHDGKAIQAKINLSFGLSYSEELGRPDKRDKKYSIDHKGTLNFVQEQIKFWIPLKAGKGTSGGNNTTTVTAISPVIPPQFPGGEAELNKFLSRNIKYPAGGLELKDSFTWVIISVKIDKKGNPEKTTLPMKDVFIKEAFRVANLLPKFEPAKINGQPVASEYDFSIYFRYDSDTTKIDTQKSQANFKVINGVPTARSKATVVTINPGKSNSKEFDKNIQFENKILKITGNQKLPMFPGGKNGLKEFFMAHTQYPATALKSKISGQAVMQATINANGEITNLKTLHADHTAFEQEAISVLREMPRWEPGLKDGKAADFTLVFPFVFALESKQNIPALRLPANRSQLYVQDAINIIGYSQVISGKTIVKKSITPSGNNIKTDKPETLATKPAPAAKEITPTKTNTPVPDNDPIFTFVEQPPVFKGGEEEMNKFIKANLKYPAEAKEKEVTGLVVIQFTVNKTGQVSDPKIVKSLGAGTDEEAIKMLNKMPPFAPAKQNGQPVNFRYTLPIRFDVPPKVTTGAIPATPGPEKIFTFVEMQPQYPGGEAALRNFISRELKYPAEAKARKTEGLVVVQFVVNTDGKVLNPKVVKSLGYGMDEEALRVVKLLPTFKPARQNNNIVAFQYTLPIRFALATEAAPTEIQK